MADLATFAAQHRTIEYTTPSSETFDTLRALWSHPEIVPSGIICPSTIQEVGTVVAFLAKSNIPFTVRAGGHDMQGRSTKDDTLIQSEGFMTPVGSISQVGYVGWAMYGGYGAYSAHFGLGVDQIAAAKIGRGVAFGVIVEMTTKIYPLDKILAGVVMYKSDDLVKVIRQYNRAYRALAAEGLPDALSVHQCVISAPAPTLALLCITDEVANVIAHYTSNAPKEPHIIYDVHQLRATSPSAKPNPDAVFSTREGHFVHEITAVVQDEKNLEAAQTWGREFQEALQKTSADNILPASYVSYLTREEFNHDKIFGEHLPFLRELKTKYDPENVFKEAISYL
ncbi:hypothetical protein BJX70DRAFT_388952 [Aspergillus crustosus]